MRKLNACVRLVSVLSHAIRGWWTITWQFPRLTPGQRHARVQAWALEMLARLAVRPVVSGTPPTAGPVLLTANHVSWLDILVLHGAGHCRFVSKADVRHWPLIGTLATGAGTLYIERASRRDAMRVVHHMAQALRSGDVLAVFPEGTTGDGHGVLPFHANLLQAAISADAPVQPVMLRYVDGASGERSAAPSFVGDDTLVGSIWRTLNAQGLVAMVTFGEPQRAGGRERRALAADCRASILELHRASLAKGWPSAPAP